MSKIMADTQTKIPKERPRKITVGVRLSDEEFKQLEEKSHGTTVANFLRTVGLGDKTKPMRRRKPPPKTDPNFIRVFCGLANNVNQLTRYAHLSKKADALDVAELAYQLAQVKEALDKMQYLAIGGDKNDGHHEQTR